jgi:histidine triad (HIT) family protein
VPHGTLTIPVLARLHPNNAEDEDALAFRDISPQAPTHFLVIPKASMHTFSSHTKQPLLICMLCVPLMKVRDGLTRLSRANEGQKMLLGHLLYVAQLVAKQEKLDPGFRVVINDGPEGKQVHERRQSGVGEDCCT